MRSLAKILLGAVGAMTLGVAVPATAHANVLTPLPQNAPGMDQTFSPAYDYDGDGCYATAAIGADGTITPASSSAVTSTASAMTTPSRPTPTPTRVPSATTAGVP